MHHAPICRAQKNAAFRPARQALFSIFSLPECLFWDSGPVLRRVVRWVANMGRGKEDRRQTLTKAEFVEGGTIGVVKRGQESVDLAVAGSYGIRHSRAA